MRRIFHVALYGFALFGFLLLAAYVSLEWGFTDTKGIIDRQRYSLTEEPAWRSSEEWSVLKEAARKDREMILRAAREADLSPRILVSELFAEQMRLFYSDRELFKTAFAPLRILARQSQFSWGVMGIKKDTAVRIEENLKNPESPFYLGKEFETLLDFTTPEMSRERFERLTHETDHYWSYLYAALYTKEIMAQWEKAGFPLTDPAIIATLYNIGFDNSHPKENPQSGGADIDIEGVSYSFGSLANEFYYSSELLDLFPHVNVPR